MKRISFCFYLISMVLGVLLTERRRNRAPSSTLYASFDLVAFGTCPYQPTRIQLHTQSHKHASKITKYHLLLSFDLLSLPPSFSLSLSLALAHSLIHSLSSSCFLLFACSCNLRARVHRWAPDGDVNGNDQTTRCDSNKTDTRALRIIICPLTHR